MPSVRYLLLPVVAAFVFAKDANAQLGLLDARTRFAVLTGVSQPDSHGPLLAIVLWRGAPGWEHRGNAERARVDSVTRWASLRAEEANRSFFGSGLAYGLLDREYRYVIVEGQHFPIVAGDSALIVMVTVPPDGSTRAIASARIRTAAVPDSFWGKSWISGDTTFIVSPKYPRNVEILRTALLESPAVAAYLR